MQQPDEVRLNREEGEALIERLERDALTSEDRRVLVQLIRLYFWLLFALQEARFSLKRLRRLLFGDKRKKRQKGSRGGSSGPGEGDGPSASAGGKEVAAGRRSRWSRGWLAHIVRAMVARVLRPTGGQNVWYAATRRWR